MNKQDAERITTEHLTYTYPQIYGFMKKLQASDFTDIQDRRSVINIFLRAVYLKDDEYTLLFNTGTRPMRVTKELRKEITEKFTDDSVCSSTSSVVPPNQVDVEHVCQKQGKILSRF